VREKINFDFGVEKQKFIESLELSKNLLKFNVKTK
jgi:hypothetical protein